MKDLLAQYFDAYSRVARVYPALLMLAPTLWTVAMLKPALIGGGAIEMAFSALATFGGLNLLSAVARSRGKAIEPGLMAD